MTTANPITLSSNTRLFKRVNLLFWVMWVVMIASIALEIDEIQNAESVRNMITEEQAECLNKFPSPRTFSPLASNVFWGMYIFSQFFFIAIMATVHIAVRRFAHGRVFVQETLTSFKTLGWLIIAWTFYETLASNTLLYVLNITGELQAFQPDLEFDVTSCMVGVFILFFKFVIERAIALENEVELTV